MLATLGTVLLMAWFFSTRWREHAETVVGDMPPPGTPVRIDNQGLTIGSTTTPWPALTLMRVNLRKARRTYASFRRYYVEQLTSTSQANASCSMRRRSRTGRRSPTRSSIGCIRSDEP